MSHDVGRTANAVIVFSVFGLISAGMKARIILGTLPRTFSIFQYCEFDENERADVERA